MVDLFFDDEKHQYYYKGEKVPCASDILKIVDVIAMDGIPARNIEIAAQRGTRIHEATDDWDYDLLEIDEEWEQENSDIIEYVNAYIDFTFDYPEPPMASEISLFSEKTGVAGTIDLVKKIDGKLSIIDKKTTSKVGKLRNLIQLNLYRINWNETHEQKVDNLYILHLTNKGEYKLIPFEVDEEIVFKFINLYKAIKEDKRV